MRQTYLTVIPLLFVGVINAQLVNGGFEEWSPLPNFDVPASSEQTFANSNELTFYFWEVLSMYEVPGTMGSAMRVETTTNGTETEVGFALWGNAPEGDELLFSGGFPMADNNVTGISCDLRYSINFSSPGFIIVQFKNQGLPAGDGSVGPGTYAFPLIGSQTEFTPTSFTFDPPVAAQIDECIIGFISNNVLDEEPVLFVGDFIEVDNLAFTGSNVEIPGGDFDTWQPANEVLVPEGWEVPQFIGLNLVERTEDASSGAYAVQINTIDVGTELLSSIVFQGESVEDVGILPTIPVTGNLQNITFSYKYDTPGNDAGFAIVVMSEMLNPDPEDLYFGSEFLLPTDTYTEQTIDVSWVNELIEINYVGVAFISSWDGDSGIGNAPVAGSALFIDDVSLNTLADPCDVAVEIQQGEMLLLCPEETTVVSVPDDFQSYQWYRQMMFGGEPEILVGETQPTLEVDAFNFSVFNVWCEVTFDDCTVESSVIGIDSFVFVPTVIASTETTICQGDSTALEALGAQGTVVWFQNGAELEGENDPVLVVFEPGTYLASIFPTDCPNTELSSGIGVTITVNPTPEPVIVIEADGLNVTGGEFIAYEWYYNGAIVEEEDSSFIAFQGGAGGAYEVIVTDINGCQGSAEEVLSSIKEDDKAHFSIYPNPANDRLLVSTIKGEYMIFDLTGRMVEQNTIFGDQVYVDVAHLVQGIYFFRTGNATQRFLIQR